MCANSQSLSGTIIRKFAPYRGSHFQALQQVSLSRGVFCRTGRKVGD